MNDKPDRGTGETEQPDLGAAVSDLTQKVARLEKKVGWLEEHARLILEAIPTSMLLRELADRTDVAEEDQS